MTKEKHREQPEKHISVEDLANHLNGLASGLDEEGKRAAMEGQAVEGQALLRASEILRKVASSLTGDST
jgi:hypothetical protein